MEEQTIEGLNKINSDILFLTDTVRFNNTLLEVLSQLMEKLTKIEEKLNIPIVLPDEQ